jgi:hypothetical protein
MRSTTVLVATMLAVATAGGLMFYGLSLIEVWWQGATFGPTPWLDLRRFLCKRDAPPKGPPHLTMERTHHEF